MMKLPPYCTTQSCTASPCLLTLLGKENWTEWCYYKHNFVFTVPGADAAAVSHTAAKPRPSCSSADSTVLPRLVRKHRVKNALSEVGFEPTPGEPDCDLNAAP